MDSERFDRLARCFGRMRTRRQTVRGLAGAVAVGAFAIGRREASARCTRSGKGCKNTSQCCSGLTCQSSTRKRPAKTCQTDPNCPQPSPASTYTGSCTGITIKCTADGTLLSATCDDGRGDQTTPSIIVNDCASTNYAIGNLFGALICGTF